LNTSWQPQFSLDARLLPHLVDLPTDQVLLSYLSEEDYRKASFLDQRIITPQLKRQLVTWTELSNIQMPDTRSPQYIFHIGHVGSTLVSRLLGEIGNVLALREPHLLRDLCDISATLNKPQCPWSPERFGERIPQAIGWLSRTFQSEQRVMIKASSFVSELASMLLNKNAKALFLFVPFQRYLATILAGEASIQETHAMSGARLQRLTKRLGEAPANLWELSLIQRIALNWVCEMSTLVEAYKTSKTSNILWMNFDAFLQNPSDKLVAIAEHFGHDLSSNRADELVTGPIMLSYSKAPEHDYSPNLREELLDEASKKHADDIQSTMLWVDKLATKYPLIQDAMQLAETH